MAQMEMGMDIFRDGPEQRGRAGSRESRNGMIALPAACGRAGFSKCVHVGGRAWGIPKSKD